MRHSPPAVQPSSSAVGFGSVPASPIAGESGPVPRKSEPNVATGSLTSTFPSSFASAASRHGAVPPRKRKSSVRTAAYVTVADRFSIVGEVTVFVRGDSNGDRALDISDPTNWISVRRFQTP